jgi:hypothetical protein
MISPQDLEIIILTYVEAVKSGFMGWPRLFGVEE